VSYVSVDSDNENHYRLRVSSADRKTPPQRLDRPAEPLRIPSDQLLGAAGQAVIIHKGREYILRQTQNGKLILTA
jgi:hemin uptake protein HemP